MSEVTNVLFIINKFAGTGYQPHVEGKIIQACEALDIECTLEFTRGRGHATQLAREGVQKKFQRIIAMGGDGTVNEVAQGLLNTEIPMGIVPKGSGNGLARHLGIDLEFESAVRQALSGVVIPMDAFVLNSKLSVNVSGLGFDGHIADLFSAATKRGLWGYSKLVFREYRSYREFELNITLDTHPPVNFKAFMVAIANASQYGNNAKVAPTASLTDQQLNIAVMKKIPWYKMLSFGNLMFTGKLRASRLYTPLLAKHATLTVSTPVQYHVDGEPCGTSSIFTISILEKSLKVIVPHPNLGKV